MKRINKENINSPASYDAKFDNKLGISDLERFEKLAKYFKIKNGRYLDVGCFDSPMPMLLAERYPNAEIHAVDQAPGMVAFLGTHIKKVHYRIADCYHLPYRESYFNYVVAGELIEHLERPDEFIEECLRVLLPGGWLAISTPYLEANNEVGGPYHLWQWDLPDMKTLGFAETEVLKEENFRTILAWRQK
jgi:ubiquinone/menaquinone biosynthesis C-methylase UbiE